MSWTIHVIRNNLKLTDACVAELVACEELADESCGFCWYEARDVVDKDGKPIFNEDFSEHMDWLSRDEAKRIICKHMVGTSKHGDVCFANFEGDGAPSFWGYRFFGDGTSVKLGANVVWSPEK